MTGARAAAERRPDSRAALAAYEAGRGAEAEAIGRAVLARDPRDAGAHYVCGLVAADRGALDRAPVRVPYRCNRAAIFDSSLIHESGGVRFRPGYANRRINLTLLFGDRAETR